MRSERRRRSSRISHDRSTTPNGSSIATCAPRVSSRWARRARPRRCAGATTGRASTALARPSCSSRCTGSRTARARRCITWRRRDEPAAVARAVDRRVPARRRPVRAGDHRTSEQPGRGAVRRRGRALRTFHRNDLDAMKNPLAAARRVAAFAARHRSIVLFVAAIGFGALAVFGARGYLAERLAIERARLEPARTTATVAVVVARRDLEAGALVDPESMAVREIPADLVPGSAVLPERFDEHAGARITQPMRSGEPLLAQAIAGVDDATFSSRIRPGIRAMSVLVDEVNSVSGMLQPGDRIDLLFTVRPPVGPGTPPAQEVTSTLLQDVAVLATGRQVRAEAGEPGGMRHVTANAVEASPSTAQRPIVGRGT